MGQDEVMNKIFKRHPNIELAFFQIQELAKVYNISINQMSLHHACEKLADHGELQKRQIRGEEFFINYDGKEIRKIIRRGYAYSYHLDKTVQKITIFIKVKNK